MNPLVAMGKLVGAIVVFLFGISGVAAGADHSLEEANPGVVQARPGYEFSFPEDHGSHDAFRIEWWYFTGHLFGEDGRRFGYELTFFRRAVDDSRVVGNPSAWAIRHLYFAHFAVTDEKNRRFQFAEKLSRAGLGKAGAKSGILEVWIDQWICKALSADHHVLQLQGAAETFSIDLKVTSQKPPVVHGDQGVSLKGLSPGQASHYYSLTRLSTEGILRIDGDAIQVKGVSWMDHEFGSGELGHDQVGWDWFSLQLEPDLEIMMYQMRRDNGMPDPASSGTVVFPNGNARHLPWEAVHVTVQDFWVSPMTRARYPSKWHFEIPSLDLSLDISPRLANQELVTNRSTQVAYWEGAVDVYGRFQGNEIKGRGYVELTGYATPLRKVY